MQQDGTKARQVLEHFLATQHEEADATLINILAELYMADEDWLAASKLIEDAAGDLYAGSELPIDLQVCAADTKQSADGDKFASACCAV